MIELSVEQQLELLRGQPVEVVDSDSGECVVLRKDVFERVKRMIYDGSEWGDGELFSLLAQSSTANGWEEPGMDDYDRYDEERRKRCP